MHYKTRAKLRGLGAKGGRCVRLTTLPPSCAVVMKCGNLNFLEPSGPLQACNGTALPLNGRFRCHVNKEYWFSFDTAKRYYKLSTIRVI
jgi:hypothetical protein